MNGLFYFCYVERQVAFDVVPHRSLINKLDHYLILFTGNCPTSIKELAYEALVRPHLEYASPVWDPWMDRHVKQIKAVQRRSAQLV